MNLVTPYARIMSPNTGCVIANDFSEEDGITLLRKVEWCARISHRSEDKQTPDSWRRLLTAVVIEHGDWSVTEHASVTVDFLVDRGITHEIVRHRMMSFTQESTRFVNYEKKIGINFISPVEESEVVPHYPIDQRYIIWKDQMERAETGYRDMLTSGAPPQIARSVLPNALASRLIVTANLRSWRHFLLSRTTREAHPQMREVTIPLLAEFQSNIPILFDDITPMDKQSEAFKKAR